jgi:hypothetical protein
MIVDLAADYYAKPKLKPWQIRAFIAHYRAQLAGMTAEGRKLVEWKIREWERCIA